MPIPTVDLDIRRFGDLVEEGRSLIPRYAPEWTEHNASDPGITLIELLAWVADQGFYRVNRVPEHHRRKFLALVGVAPRPPLPATALVSFELRTGQPARTLPAGTVVSAGRGAPQFSTVAALTVAGAHIAALQSFDGRDFTDLTASRREGLAFAPFGPDPPDPAGGAEPAFYVGLDRVPATGGAVNLWLSLAMPGTPPVSPQAAHHAARTEWECWDGSAWRLCPASDDTYSFTTSGAVRVTPPAALVRLNLGAVASNLYWLRCRLVGGRLDAAPLVEHIDTDAVGARQAVPMRQTLQIAAGVSPRPGAPVPAAGAVTPVWLELDGDERVVDFSFAAYQGAPQVRLLSYSAATASSEGTLTLAAGVAGVATGLPEQTFELPAAPVAGGDVELFSLATGAPAAVRFNPRADLDAAGRDEAAFVLDAASGLVRFGDGERGAVPAEGDAVIALYETTAAAEGVAPAGIWRLTGADDLLNRALLGTTPAAVQGGLVQIVGRPEARGADAEDVETAVGRGAERLWAHERLLELAQDARTVTLDGLERGSVLELPAPQRAATLLDYERLAFAVPGTAVARARAWAGVDPRLPGLRAPGTVTVVVLPWLPRDRPVPTRGLLDAVWRFLARHRIVGTRLVVLGPRYVDVEVAATVRAVAGADPARVRARVVSNVERFLHPLAGGAAANGWPFGRDVYRSELMQLVDGTDGVDHVRALTLTATGHEGTCGDVCVEPDQLVAAGRIDVEVSA